MAIRTIGVVGSGVIGASWTGLFLAHGFRVLASDPAPEADRKLTEHLRGMWPLLEKAGLAPGASLSNCEFIGSTFQGRYEEIDFVQENGPENVEFKLKLMAELDEALRPEVIIASSSSGIPSSQFVQKCRKSPQRILIGHPFNPPHIMPLVEVVPHPGTKASIVEQTMSFYRKLNRRPVLIRQEIPGHVANRLQATLVAEAYSLVSRGVISSEDLDACMRNSLGPRWTVVGPFMANAMGGGGGSQGFNRFLEHLGPAMQGWIQDIKANEFDWSLASIEKLSASLREEFGAEDVRELEEQRDLALVEVIRLMKGKT